MSSKTKLIPVEKFLIDSLRDPEEALCYLVVAYEEFVEDNDLTSFLNSLQLIAAAKAGALQLAEKAEVDIEGLHRLFKRTSSPGWEEVLKALGYTFSYLNAEAVPYY